MLNPKKIYSRLASIAEFNVWIDKEDLLPGEKWDERIPKLFQKVIMSK